MKPSMAFCRHPCVCQVDRSHVHVLSQTHKSFNESAKCLIHPIIKYLLEETDQGLYENLKCTSHNYILKCAHSGVVKVSSAYRNCVVAPAKDQRFNVQHFMSSIKTLFKKHLGGEVSPSCRYNCSPD